MNPRLFSLFVTIVYGLFATLGIFELIEALDYQYRLPLCILLSISNVVYTLCIVVAAFNLFIACSKPPKAPNAFSSPSSREDPNVYSPNSCEHEQSQLWFFIFFFIVAKIVLASIAIKYLREDDDMPKIIMTLFIIEIVLVFLPVTITVALGVGLLLHHAMRNLTSPDHSNSIVTTGPSVTQQTLEWEKKCITRTIWTLIIILFLMGVLDLVQAIMEDYLRTFFILTAVANMALPTLSVYGSAFIDPYSIQGSSLDNKGDVHIVLHMTIFAKLAILGFALHAVIVDPNMSVLAQVACYFEIIPLGVPVAFGLIIGALYLFCSGVLFCLKFNQVIPQVHPESNVQIDTN